MRKGDQWDSQDNQQGSIREDPNQRPGRARNHNCTMDELLVDGAQPQNSYNGIEIFNGVMLAKKK